MGRNIKLWRKLHWNILLYLQLKIDFNYNTPHYKNDKIIKFQHQINRLLFTIMLIWCRVIVSCKIKYSTNNYFYFESKCNSMKQAWKSATVETRHLCRSRRNWQFGRVWRRKLNKSSIDIFWIRPVVGELFRKNWFSSWKLVYIGGSRTRSLASWLG